MKGDADCFYQLISKRRELLYKTAFLFVKKSHLDRMAQTASQIKPEYRLKERIRLY